MMIYEHQVLLFLFCLYLAWVCCCFCIYLTSVCCIFNTIKLKVLSLSQVFFEYYGEKRAHMGKEKKAHISKYLRFSFKGKTPLSALLKILFSKNVYKYLEECVFLGAV